VTDGVARVLLEGVAVGAWSHASVVVVRDGAVVREAHTNSAATRFDIASVTKVFTATAALAHLSPDDRIPWLDGAPTVAQLLSHASGLPAWRPLFAFAARELGTTPAVLARDASRSVEVRALYRRLIASTKADAVRPTYSDLGFMALGFALEEATGRALGDLLSLEGASADASGAIATGRGRPRRGNPPAEAEVVEGVGIDDAAADVGPDDDNAACAGGLCGHAGLFATAEAVARFGDRLLRDAEDGSGGLLPAEQARRMFTRVAGSRTCGLDTPSGEVPSIGTLLGRGALGAAGHLGFTGCSWWVDRDARLSVALLTDAVACSRPYPLLRVWRPLVHDAVARSIGSGEG
jgi:CubicO group peptidase (beta-lactamase class C family)